MSEFEKETILWTLEKCIKDITSLDDLKKIKTIIKSRERKIAGDHRYNLIIGEEVKVVGTTKFRTAKIKKLNPTRAKVEVYIDGKKAIYHVPYTMLR